MRNSDTVKEHYKELKEEVKTYKKSLYQGYPEVEQFENRKRTCLKALLIILFVHTVLRIYNMNSMADYNIFLLIVSSFIKVDWIFLLAAMNPKWQLSIFLFIMALNNGWEFISSFAKANVPSLANFIELYTYIFNEHPLAAVNDILLLIYIILTLAVTIWLIIPAKNRKYADQSDALNLKIKEFTASHSGNLNTP